MNTNNKNKILKNWKLVNFCEFDKYATKSYCAIHNVDETKNLGDITKVDENELDDFSMMTWGFPCTDISVAGKQKGFINEDGEKTRSGMYYEGIRILRKKKPALSIIENVKNLIGKRFKNEFEMVLSDLDDAGYNSYYKVLNAKNYGIPQNRERVFIVSIRKDLDNGKFKFPEPFDNGLRLKDLLEDDVDEKFYISNEKTQKFITNIEEKYNKNKTAKFVCEERKDEGIRTFKDEVCGALRTIDACGDKRVVEIDSPKFIGNVNREDFGTGYAGGVWDDSHISPTLTTMQGGGRQPHVITGIDKSYNNPKFIETANCITSREDRGISNRKSEGTAVLKIGNINPSGNGMNGSVYSEEGLSTTLTTNKGEGNKVAIKQATKQGYIECEVGGVADPSYPNSKTRRGRVQDDGNTYPTITATETGICRVEQKKQDDFGDFYDYISVIFECLDCMKIVTEGEMKDEERYQKFRKILYVLWEEIRKETVQWKARGFWSIPEEKILQSRMHDKIQTNATKPRCDMEDCTSNCTENKRKNIEKDEMRNMWKIWEVRCSSYKLELERQFFEEFTSVMSKLSYQNTQNKKCMLDMWRTDERIGLLQQALFEIQELRMSINGKEKTGMSRLQKDNRKSNKMCGIRIRKLTPKETFRLMGFSDENFDAAQRVGISNSQLYKQAGNSIVVDVLYYIYRELYIAMPYLFDDLKLSSFFSGIGAFEIALDKLYKDINSVNFTRPQEE